MSLKFIAKSEPAGAGKNWVARWRGGLVAMAVASSLLSGCGWLNANSGEAHDDTVGWSAEQLYRDAKSELDSGNWEAALTQLERVQARYPFGVYAQQAMLDTAYAQWRSGSREQALATIQRFQQQYPNHEATDYMLYLKGLVTFAPENAFINRLVGQDMAERDPAGARASFEAFTELVQRYPDSRYARDARLRLNWLLNTIAMGELYTARYYYNRQAYVAAINRAETVIADFQGTEAAEQALYLMVLSYEQLDMPELRDDARRVLVTNFPQTRLLSEGFPDTSNSKWWNPFSWSSNL